jgi:hypothetical protein
MTQPVKVALGLWLLLAIVVFNVRYDWQARMAGHAFVRSQIARHAQGLPTLSINDGYRPMVRAAARHSALWLVAIAAAGVGATTIAARAQK